MNKYIYTTFLLFFLPVLTFSQSLTQTVRGTVLDADSKLPLIGVGVSIFGTNPVIGAITDEKGIFRLEKTPVGKITLKLAYLGYENVSVPNIEVNSGKEVVLELSMQESVIQTGEVVIESSGIKGEALNEMSMISSRSISPEESKRFAGSFNDPARILSNYAGVATTQDGSNDVIVRGNSPKYIQWRLEGMEITNPNHFADQNGVSGGISALNNNLLATSDFHTGAFSAEYGDVLSGVYDVNLRRGNNENFEAALGVGILGTDVTAEGPFKKGYKGSYLANYRYSNISLIDKLGLVDAGGIPTFQDGAFKVVLPAGKAGEFSLYGLGGASAFLWKDVKPSVWDTPGDRGMNKDITEDYEKKAFLANAGLQHVLPITQRSFLKTAFSYSANGISDEVTETKTQKILDPTSGIFLRDSILTKMVNFKSKLIRSTYRAAITYHIKLNASHKIQAGVKYAEFQNNDNQSLYREDLGTRFTTINFRQSMGTVRNFISWKWRLHDKLTMVSGLHNMNVLLNNKHTLEPRIAFQWKINQTISLHAGYGSHSTMESIHNYFAKVKMKDGSITEPNRDLDLLKAHHYVIGAEKRFFGKMMAKLELYYQDLYNLPVENSDTSLYSTINEGLEFRYVDLVNKGTGKNYGVELTIERFFANSYYYLINGSVYNSTYRSLNGQERNTQYNGNYLVNALFGKEYTGLGKKKNRTLTLNAKVFFGGGRKIIPLLRDAGGRVAVDPANGNYWDYSKAYQKKIQDTYSITLSCSYKFQRPKATHELFINLDNVTDSKGKISEYYDESKPDGVGYVQQFGFFPNLMYRIYF